MRQQSAGTEAAYSDFEEEYEEDEGEQAAVGSGIVETNENYDDENSQKAAGLQGDEDDDEDYEDSEGLNGYQDLQANN